MPVLVHNPSGRRGLRLRRLSATLERVLHDHECAHAYVDVSLVTDRAMRRLNREFAGADYATDVLSFPQQEDQAPPGPGALLLGDVCIAVGVAARQAQEHGCGLNAEIERLAVHGTLHLLGYDHHTEAERREMETAASRYV